MNVLPSIGRWLARGELVLVYASMLAAFAIMCLTSADALSRYLLNRPIIGAYEITEKYLMVAAIYLGLVRLSRRGHPRDVPGRPPACSGEARGQCFAYLVSLAFCLIILVTTQQALRALSDDTTLSALPLPVGPAYSFVPLGFLALTVAMLADLTRIRSGRSYLFRAETPSA